MMKTNNLGYPRIGEKRELKKACESFWEEKISADELMSAGRAIRKRNWLKQKESGIDLIPSNDFSFYDHVLDTALLFGATPVRFKCLQNYLFANSPEFYFALARGYQKEGFDIPPMEMTKWFDTNYHYIVPEFYRKQKFRLFSTRVINEFLEAKELGITAKPVIISPVSFLLLGKTKDHGFDPLDLLPEILPLYLELLGKLSEAGAEWIQIDEPFLVTEISDKIKDAIKRCFKSFRNEFPGLKFMLATYFEGINENSDIIPELGADAIHLDIVRALNQLPKILDVLPETTCLSLGIVDGRNIWKNDFSNSLKIIQSVRDRIGEERVIISPSCSLIHTPISLDAEDSLPPEIKGWLAFADQKLGEITTLAKLGSLKLSDISDDLELFNNQQAIGSRKLNPLIFNEAVRKKSLEIPEIERLRRSDFRTRKITQQQKLNLPLLPATTIGSFPQTSEVRSWRSKLKKGQLTAGEYERLLRNEIEKAIRWQEDAGLDVLVHGEFERNDMVEYFGEMLEGFAFTKNGWVQSYGSRYVKPPIIYGDVSRRGTMTVKWIKYAQTFTKKPVKGMLTGPVTMVQWSFVRDDQSLFETCFQVALALREEVLDLEKAGISVIQIDEPAFREGLPLRTSEREAYLDNAVRAFRITHKGIRDDTQIHTHMCYSEFNDIIRYIAAMDADVITIESSRSGMELLDSFAGFKYPNDIGPGVYDIHSPRIPSTTEILDLLKKAMTVIPMEQLWVNPDCGLKTRSWEETKSSISNMLAAVKLLKLKNAVLVR